MESMTKQAAFLRIADEIALEMADEAGADTEDIRGEAYLGLAEALHDLGDDADEEAVEDRIRCHMLAVREEREALAASDRCLIAQVEELKTCIDRLTEEMGEKPNFDELANAMGISQDKVLAILKLAGEDVDEA